MFESYNYNTGKNKNISQNKKETGCFLGHESFNDAERVINDAFFDYGKRLTAFFKAINSSSFYGQRKEDRDKIVLRKVKEIQSLRFGLTDSLVLGVGELPIEDIERKRLLNKIQINSEVYIFFIREIQDINNIIDSKNVNFKNIVSAEMQQHIAMTIITNPDGAGDNFEHAIDIAWKACDFSKTGVDAREYFNNDLSLSLKKGIYGLVSAYYHYSQDGYKVIFPDAKLDANAMIDLIVVNEEDMDDETKKKLYSTGIDVNNLKNLNNLPDEIKKYIFKVQVKCTGDREPRLEKEFKYVEKNKLSYDEIGYDFFKSQGELSNFNCKFLSLPLSEAKRYMKGEDYGHKESGKNNFAVN